MLVEHMSNPGTSDVDLHALSSRQLCALFAPKETRSTKCPASESSAILKRAWQSKDMNCAIRVVVDVPCSPLASTADAV
jgi:hypothetical protein